MNGHFLNKLSSNDSWRGSVGLSSMPSVVLVTLLQTSNR